VHPSGLAGRQVWPELLGLEMQSKIRNCTQREGRVMGMVEEGKECSRHPSHPSSRFRAYSLLCFTGPKEEQPSILMNFSHILLLQHDWYECQELED